MYYLFDGTFDGFLCCVFNRFIYKDVAVVPLTNGSYQPDAFKGFREITSDVSNARRVLKGAEALIGWEATMDFYKVFLSEDEKAWQAAFRLLEKLFTSKTASLKNFGDGDALYFSQTLKKVHRERHRMQAFIRFQKSKDDLYAATIKPDFNVLPLIAKFFRERYADQRWLIYDLKRNYGLIYNLKTVNAVEIYQPDAGELISADSSVQMADDELLWQQLWKQYFKSTNIAARKNTRLHLRHVPRRYWHLLTEKQSSFSL